MLLDPILNVGLALPIHIVIAEMMSMIAVSIFTP